MLKGRTIAVVGAGIGGLTAATALAQRGAKVTVYEQAPALGEVGAGLQLSPNGGRVLQALGMGPALDAKSVQAQALEPHDGRSGTRLGNFPLGGDTPHRLIYRPEVIAILANAASQAGVELALGQAKSGPEAYAEAELTVGADGLHSVLRPGLNGADAPFFTGQVAWRAVIDADAPPVTRLWMAPGAHVVSYPLSAGRVNLIAIQERKEWTAEGWQQPGDPGDLRHAFQGFSGRVTGLLDQVDSVGVWGLHLHPVAERWHDGQARALLGDAAHPTLPFLGQGANMAIEDAWVLAAALDALPQGEALAAYQAVRRPRVARAVRAARGNARSYHLGGVPRRVAAAGIGAFGRFAPGLFMKRFEWLYAHDVTDWQPG